jgi:predicted DsbA family dithiol-disulfide isomerase
MLGAFRHLPLDIHANAKTAAEAAACAGRQGLFWQMHDRQFAAKAKLETAGVVSLAEGLGLDMSQFRKCLEGEELSAKIRDEVTSAAALGIRSTPTILIGRNDGQKHVVVSALLAGAKPVAAFRDAIETARTPPSTYYGVGSVASVIALGGFWFISRNRKKPNKN